MEEAEIILRTITHPLQLSCQGKLFGLWAEHHRVTEETGFGLKNLQVEVRRR